MFPIKCKKILPIEHLIIKSVAVRGELGPLTVWVSNNSETETTINNNDGIARPPHGDYAFRLSARHWTKIYEQTHLPSRRVYKVLTFDTPIVLLPGQVRALYIHSQLQGDQSIVYDNSSHPHPAARHDDAMLTIFSGKAHLSPVPFGQTPICELKTRRREE
jgi:hypothetical protein